jgi:hypothetical protein
MIADFASSSHVAAFDAALRDARTELPATADARRADKGLCLARNSHVALYGTTQARVVSERDPEVVYHVHSRGGCDCPDAIRRREANQKASPGAVACKHYFAAVLTALAHLNLAVKGYVPEADCPVYPAVALDEEHYGLPVRASECSNGSWYAEFYNGKDGYFTESAALELWERTPEHITAWNEAVRSWERWLQGR